MADDKILEAMVDAFDFTILGTRGNRQDALNAMQAALTAYRAVSDDAKDAARWRFAIENELLRYPNWDSEDVDKLMIDAAMAKESEGE